MAEENESGEERVVLDARTLQSISPETLARLRSEFGMSVELKSTKPGLSGLLDSLTRGGTITTPQGMVAAYDRGFDRTSPGYDKYYDRDRALANPAQDLINPAINPGSLIPGVANPAQPGLAPVVSPGIDAGVLNRLTTRP
ncbi:hypothetical protein [Massilia scottii]|uniref:hypothetical protein n=1 Tax=Massilia scottii TaxID=3057166 RepID=UPI002796A743|nr:hypothetical protein [Massilia sp. CCM 9029]MDQ1833642.1 hypothetical protein [Massilia sp. CCM 9029]